MWVRMNGQSCKQHEWVATVWELEFLGWSVSMDLDWYMIGHGWKQYEQHAAVHSDTLTFLKKG